MRAEDIHALVRKLMLAAAAPGLLSLSSCCFGGGGNCGREWVTFPPELTRPDSGFVLPADGGFADTSDCNVYCDGGAFTCRAATDAGPNAVECRIQCVGGRAPPGLLALGADQGAAAGYLARSAALEAASVDAFEQLARELSAHRMPTLARAAARAANDERRHARILGRLAGVTPRPRIAATPLRSLEEIAVDNAAEGCGRELVGALMNLQQARGPLGAAMAPVARDELSHAAFSFALARELSPRLPLAARRRMREAQHRALHAFEGDALPDATRAQLGLPDAEAHAAQLRALREVALLG